MRNNSNAGAAAAGAGYSNRNQSPGNAGAAAAGAGYSNRNQSPGNAGAAAAGAGYANRNQGPSNAGAAAAGAGYANRNQGPSTAGAAAAGAGYANRNQGLDYPGAAGAAAGAGYANRNQGPEYPGAAGAAAGAGYANRNQYNQYHPGMAGGYGYGNYGYVGGTASRLSAASGPGAWARRCTAGATRITTTPITVFPRSGRARLPLPRRRAAAAYDYSQPISTTAAAPDAPVADQASAGFDQARDAFKQGNYPQAVQLGQQALGQMPNDPNLTSSSRWGCSLRASTTRPRRQSTRSCRSVPAGTGRP